MKTPFLAIASLLVVPGVLLAQGQGAFKPTSWGAHMMHTHHLASMHHVAVLNAYNDNLDSIPKETLQEQVKVIQRETAASRKHLNSLSEDQLSADAVKGIKKSHAQTMKAAKAISEELQKDDVDHEAIAKQVSQMNTALREGETHIHAAYDTWKLSPVHRRLHPGT